jgi:hypothetical protein
MGSRPLLFISYLRTTGRGYAKAIQLQLEKSFDKSEIYFDRNPGAVPVGSSWPKKLREAISHVHIVLAVIDPRWEAEMTKFHRGYAPKAEMPYMCEELRLASELNKIIIPVLAGGARMPKAKNLPSGASEIVTSNIQAVELSDILWDDSFENLVPELKELCVEFLQLRRALESKSRTVITRKDILREQQDAVNRAISDVQ